MPNAIVVVDEGGSLELVNARAERLFAYDHDELYRLPLEMLVPERFRGGHAPMRHRYWSGPTTRAMGEGRDLFGLRKDGREVPIEIGLNPIALPEGQFVLASIIDITERKHAEQLRLTNAGMLQHNAELEALNAELESFSYSVSHDLRVPVRALVGFTARMQDDYGPALDDEGRRLLAVVHDEAARMDELIDELLAFSQLGRRPMHSAFVDMDHLARDVVAEHRQRGEGSGAVVEIDELPGVYGDRALLRHVWINLIDNALKYSGTCARPLIRITCTIDNAGATFAVRDNGVGFDMRYTHKLFGVFQRLHRTDDFPGTGVGLAIVKRIVQRHGGTVRAEGALGAGATFSFTLPVLRLPDA